MGSLREFAPTLTASSVPVSAEVAERLAAELYGVVGRARSKPGERDDNFVVDGDAGAFFLKVIHAAERPEVTDLVTTILRRLEADDAIPVQTVLPTLDGAYDARVEVGGASRAVRMTSFIPGRMLHAVPPAPALERELGRLLARVGLALADFEHPGAEREVAWDLWYADRARPLLDDMPAGARRDALAACLDRFESEVRPRLAHLRRQVVHNDLSGDNVVIGSDGRVAGLIDFGDATVTQLVNDVAIGMTNRLVDGPDPLAAAVDLLRGYDELVPLADQELALLYDLIRTRTAMRLAISEWRARRFPENREYIMRNTPRAWEHFERLPEAGARATTDRFAAAIGRGR